MMSCTYGCLRNVINLGNSIIGVSILAMPYCFQKCGILLSLLLIVLSGLLVRIACYLLLKGAVMARRRNFEFLAFHAMGSTGKLAVEVGVIGFLIGVCIAFFVVIGDLGPPLASEYFLIENTSNLRAEVLIFLGIFVALPLGLLRKVDSLTSLSFLSIAFYVCLVLKIFSEASSKLFENDWWIEVNWWKPEGFLPCLPIFSMALSCQTQLFEFFDTLSEPSVKRMTSVVSGAVCLCSSVYISVGLFGYIACHDKSITGNILVNMTPSLITEFIKLGFIVTVVISFPLCLFPCRTSLHSLLFKQGLGHHDIAVNFIPDQRFRVLTISLVVITVGVSIMLPNIEFVLSIIGSTIGTTICFIFPAVIFIHDANKNSAEKRLAQVVLFVGLFILVACTYSTLREGSESHPKPPLVKEPIILPQSLAVEHFSAGVSSTVSSPPYVSSKVFQNAEKEKSSKNSVSKEGGEPMHGIKSDNEKRHEPPEPQAPDIKIEKHEQNADIDPQALQKEDKEIQKESLGNRVTSAKTSESSLKEKQEQILLQLEKQQKEQKIILEQQKQVLEELKLHKEVHRETHEKVIGKADAEKPVVPLQVIIAKQPTEVLSNNIKVAENVKGETKVLQRNHNIQLNELQSSPPEISGKMDHPNNPGLKNEPLGSANVNSSLVLQNIKIAPLQQQIPETEFNQDKSNLKLPVQNELTRNMLQQNPEKKQNSSSLNESPKFSNVVEKASLPEVSVDVHKSNINNLNPSLSEGKSEKLIKSSSNINPSKDLNAYQSQNNGTRNQYMELSVDNGKREMR